MSIFRRKKEEKKEKEKIVEEKKEGLASNFKVLLGDKFILDRPLITEKTLFLAEKGKYVFLVPREVNKTEAKKQIERFYSVKVTKVSSLRQKSKPRYFRGIREESSRLKKIIVTLKEGQKIEIGRSN